LISTIQQSEVAILKLRSMTYFQEEKYIECLKISKLLIESYDADIVVHEIFAKSIIQCGLIKEYSKYLEALEDISKGNPNFQVPFFDYLAQSKKYHEMFIFIWECLTKAPSIEVMSYFDRALLGLSSISPDFNIALNDLSNQQNVDPLTRIILSFSSLEIDQSSLVESHLPNKESFYTKQVSSRWEKNDSKVALSTTQPVEEGISPEEAALQTLIPLENIAQRWRTKRPPYYLLDLKELSSHLEFVTGSKRELIVGISHDDYRISPGGVQVCIQREQAISDCKGLRYLHIHPYYPVPRLVHLDEDPDPLIVLILDGIEIGTCRMSTLTSWVIHATVERISVSVVVHHLLGHAPELVERLVLATGSNHCIFWLHDFFSMCPSFSLQRNNLVFCGAPPITSNTCMLCVYGHERETHALRMRAFFENLEISIASPSKVTAEFWLAKAKLSHASLSILPHMTLDMVPRVKPLEPNKDAVKIGFLGSQVKHKGWPNYVKLMQEFGDDNRYCFVVLSANRPNEGENCWRSVHVTPQAPNAMSDAVAIERIDVVLHWPSVPETFSFTTFEAIAGGAYIITHVDSGNVAQVVRETGRGMILGSEDELRGLFLNGGAIAIAERVRASNQTVEVIQRHSDFSFALIRKG